GPSLAGIEYCNTIVRETVPSLLQWRTRATEADFLEPYRKRCAKVHLAHEIDGKLIFTFEQRQVGFRSEGPGTRQRYYGRGRSCGSCRRGRFSCPGALLLRLRLGGSGLPDHLFLRPTGGRSCLVVCFHGGFDERILSSRVLLPWRPGHGRVARPLLLRDGRILIRRGNATGIPGRNPGFIGGIRRVFDSSIVRKRTAAGCILRSRDIHYVRRPVGGIPGGYQVPCTVQ